jgi:hypothetical protein
MNLGSCGRLIVVIDNQIVRIKGDLKGFLNSGYTLKLYFAY